jgi:D-alanyl-D-alanine carboxypeptidase
MQKTQGVLEQTEEQLLDALKIKKTKKTKELIRTVFIGVAFIFVVFAGINQESKQPKATKSVKAVSKISEKELQRIITENKAKYYPKDNWLKSHPQELALSTKSAVVLDYNTGELLYADNEHAKLPPASITKVLTAAVAMENYKKDQLCTVSSEAAEIEPYKIVMKEGEKIRVEDLLYGMMMVSANDAAEVLAECDPEGKQAFMDKMNEKVKELGLVDSHFVTPNGLDAPDHLTSAFDMATITNYAIKAHADFLNFMGNKGDYSIQETDHNQPHWWSQISTLLKTYPGMDGAKTGFTYDAGNTYIGTAQRNGRRIIIVYFDAKSTTYDATTLLDFGFNTVPN